MPASSSVEELSRKADFVFDGTVKEVTGNTASVTISTVQNGTEVLRGFEGRDVKVQLSGSRKLKEGEHATFFTKPTVYGESLEVQSLGEIQSEGSGLKLAGMGAGGDPVQARVDRDTKVRYDDSDLVVSGRVVSVSLPPEELERKDAGQVSEHDPLWRDATIQIDAVHKGAHSAKNVVVRFASSEDIKWIASPKFHVGQEGYFLLHKDEVKSRRTVGGATKSTAAYTALSPLDFQPSDQADGIKKFIGG
jgi:hypothetical protein